MTTTQTNRIRNHLQTRTERDDRRHAHAKSVCHALEDEAKVIEFNIPVVSEFRGAELPPTLQFHIICGSAPIDDLETARQHVITELREMAADLLAAADGLEYSDAK